MARHCVSDEALFCLSLGNPVTAAPPPHSRYPRAPSHILQLHVGLLLVPDLCSGCLPRRAPKRFPRALNPQQSTHLSHHSQWLSVFPTNESSLGKWAVLCLSAVYGTIYNCYSILSQVILDLLSPPLQYTDWQVLQAIIWIKPSLPDQGRQLRFSKAPHRRCDLNNEPGQFLGYFKEPESLLSFPGWPDGQDAPLGSETQARLKVFPN